MTAAVDLLLFALAVPCLIATGYLALLAVFSQGIAPWPEPAPRLFFEVVVPAHDEEAGIARTVENLKTLDYPPELFRVRVVADNCSDQTAARAQAAGAAVMVRTDANLRGKGYALAHAFDRIIAEGQAHAAVVVDADTVVSKNLLRAFAARLAAGAQAVQAEYAVQNPDASWRTRLMVIAFALFHGVRSLGRERLGLSCGLRGNGMGFSVALLREVPHDAFSVVEDLEYGIRLGRAGHRVFYAPEARVWGEMVPGEQASRSQRRRWEGGRFKLARELLPKLFPEALAQRSGLLLDLAMDLAVPPLSFLVAACVAGAGASWLAARLGIASGASLVTWGLCLGFILAYIARGWWISGLGLKGLVALAYAPVYLFWKIALLLARGKEKKGEWVRTARPGETP